MQVTILGTGTSTGVPVLTCTCPVCCSGDYRDQRLRVSIHIASKGQDIVIDTGPDFRLQALRANISKIDAILYTHEHKDHTAGLDDIRPYNYLSGIKTLPIYAHERTMAQLKSEYYYAFGDHKYPGVPLIEAHVIDDSNITVGELSIMPIKIRHHKLDILGFRVENFAYITDANAIEPSELEKLQDLDVLILNALQIKPHISHFNLEQAIAMAQKINAKKTFFTHIGHKLGLHREVEENLPEGLFLAYDGLQIRL